VAPLFLTSALDGGQLTSCPGRFTLGKEPRYPLSGGLGGLAVIGEEQNLLPLPACEPRTFQPVAQSLYRPCFIVSHRAYL